MQTISTYFKQSAADLWSLMHSRRLTRKMFPSCYSKPKNGLFLSTSLTKVIVGVFVVYVLHTCWVIYGFVYTKPCDNTKGDNCIASYLADKPRLQLSVYTTLNPNDDNGHSLLLRVDEFDIHTKFERRLAVSLPDTTHSNRSLHAVVFLHKDGVLPWKDSRQVHHVARLITYTMPQPAEVSHSSGKDTAQKQAAGPLTHTPVSHWRSSLTLNIMAEDFTFNRGAVPSDVRRHMKVVEDGKKKKYLPLLLIDELKNRIKDLIEINSTTSEVPLTISYDTISLRKFRFWIHMQAVIFSLKPFGFTEQNIDEIKGMFADTSLHLLALAILVPAFHLLFEFLAFKNDINFWGKKKSMAGMSKKSVLWRCFSTLVIFLHLLEEKSSWLILIPTGIGALIEVLKIKRVYRIHVLWKSKKSKSLDEKLDEPERVTEEYEAQVMKFLSYLLYPLCISGAVFSLLYLKKKSWYSWFINSLVSGVYAFGFLSMVPQLFINYKLKSVEHLQLSVFMYKGISTFLNDIFRGVYTIPTFPQLACFRDDVVFLIYLYQRRLYPTNKARSREYGASYRKKLQGKPHED